MLPTVCNNFLVCSLPYWLWAGVSDKGHKAFTDKEFNKLISFSFCLQAWACIYFKLYPRGPSLQKRLKRDEYISILILQLFNIWPEPGQVAQKNSFKPVFSHTLSHILVKSYSPVKHFELLGYFVLLFRETVMVLQAMCGSVGLRGPAGMCHSSRKPQCPLCQLSGEYSLLLKCLAPQGKPGTNSYAALLDLYICFMY